jgi:hypothetical protein
MTSHRWNRRSRKSDEAGQAMVLVVLALSLFLLAALAFAVDLGNLWFHRQADQGVADASCTAAAMDMLYAANGTGSSGGFTAGANFSCSASPTAAPCVYATKNMGSSPSSLTAGTPGYDVAFTFPTSVSGLPSCTTGTGAPAICSDPSALTNAFVQVNVDDRTPLFFAGMLSGSKTADVAARATCGVVEANAPIPILVLDPTGSSLTGDGNIAISIVGGPQRSIQVDSSSGSAVSISGGSGSIDLTKGGPNNNGSDFGVTGTESQVGIFTTAHSGQWLDPTAAISDPFASVPAPAKPSAPAPPTGTDAVTGCTAIPCSVPQGTHGCQDSAGCLLYTAGLYTSDIKSFMHTLIFDPGIYYMQNANLLADSQSCLRPGTGIGDGSGGTMFYFTGTSPNIGTVNVTANAGTNGVCGTSTLVPLTTVACINSGTGKTILPANVVTQNGLLGNVLLGPCQAPTVSSVCGPNCSYNYGDPLLTADPLGEQRGMLFFQDRSANLAAECKKCQPVWSGGGSFGVTGIMYFHYCDSATGAGLGTNCQSAGYTDQLTLGGGSAGTTYVVGDIVTDNLNLHGNPAIEMDLNPNALYYVMKASLLQ